MTKIGFGYVRNVDCINVKSINESRISSSILNINVMSLIKLKINFSKHQMKIFFKIKDLHK